MNKIIMCYKIQKNCYAGLWSYGEICVGCGCCQKNIKLRRKARLGYWRWWLKENLDHQEQKNLWDIQKINIKKNIIEAKKRIKYYSFFVSKEWNELPKI